jgi:hypothetical protein
VITNLIRGDIFKSRCKHIAFAVNAEGYNDAGLVSSRFWPELATTGGNTLGEALHKQVSDTLALHALVCHELKGSGWDNTPRIVEECLNNLALPDEEPLSIVMIGGGLVGQMSGADVFAILGGVARSNKHCVVYML